MIIGRRGQASSFFGSKFVSIVLSIIGLVIIVSFIYFPLKYFFINPGDEDAEKLLEEVVGKINALEVGESNEFLFRGTDGWYLTGWNREDAGRPDKCFLNNCLCICYNSADSESCQNNGFCRDIDREVEVKSNFTIGDGSQDFAQVNLVYSCIRTHGKVFSIDIEKEENKIHLFSYDSSLNQGINCLAISASGFPGF